LYLQIEQKPNKKEELMVANSVLKLAADLLKVFITLSLIISSPVSTAIISCSIAMCLTFFPFSGTARGVLSLSWCYQQGNSNAQNIGKLKCEELTHIML
jgi:hypothetical protein